MRGVNLGGWLVLERWMTERLFADTSAGDEFDLCTHLGPGAESLLRRHRETYVTRDDLAWIAAQGLNAVRIPFGYWLVDPDPPFVSGAEVLDEAVRWCDELGLAAVLDLHGAPGHQNRKHHSGRAGHFRWLRDRSYRERTLDVLEGVAQRYAGHRCVKGLSVLNEPEPAIPSALLLDFYAAAYERIRRHMRAEDVAVIVPAFPHERLRWLHGRLRPPRFENVVTDVHYYQQRGRFERLSVDDHLAYPFTNRRAEIERWSASGPLVVGEWSLRLPWRPRDVARELPPPERGRVMREFAANQIATYDATAGWFFWSYKAENEPEWSFRECVERGWISPRSTTSIPE